ncbi:segregation and condensation protein B [Halobacteroides halobius DSM 5150]|uniref:Segregation and condensation protein B n=1 Tax=Halobacteroides halobius (strain ATCC 35273 / DSM 5150 / MD-1) TaxID=748449 RepID=L0K8Y5_HALHC|nr:SMC-Scp complex subunit ScpB [Halobacteroides halobius]AGB40583.1 segregation and condensation protein B [Halobacteroides halobius DSM 5150]
MNKQEAKAAVEALLFMATDSLAVKDIKEVTNLTTTEVNQILTQLKEDYQAVDKGIKLVQVNQGFQFQTKSEYRSFIKAMHKPKEDNTLSQAALETLAIIAYKQPATRSEVEEIRGVNVEKALKTIQKRGLVEEKGRKDAIGRPIIYGTTDLFLEYMGLSSLDELPPPQEFNEVDDSEIEEELDNEPDA